MATAHLVTVEGYLNSTFEPDAEYVEGRIVYRSCPKNLIAKCRVFWIERCTTSPIRLGSKYGWNRASRRIPPGHTIEFRTCALPWASLPKISSPPRRSFASKSCRLTIQQWNFAGRSKNTFHSE